MAPTVYDRPATLTLLADGQWPQQVFGLDRHRAVTELTALVRGITPTREDIAAAALTDNTRAQRKVTAYRTGRDALNGLYYGEHHIHGDLPTL